MKCLWCTSTNVKPIAATVYWELPDGTRAIEIANTPSISCNECGIVYQEDDIVESIEDQLFLIDTKSLVQKMDYDQLMSQPRILKRNYFKFMD
jgi:uncharacterized YokU family protein